jgi:hypothetical protein
MSLEVRRIVTGHDEFGKGIVVSDEKLTAVSRGLGPNISGCEIWSTNSMPVDNSMEAEPASSRNTILSATVRGQSRGLSSGRPGTLFSRTVPRPWTIQSCCQARSMWSSTADKWSP